MAARRCAASLRTLYVFSVFVSYAAVAATDVRRVSDSPGAFSLSPLAATPLLLLIEDR